MAEPLFVLGPDRSFVYCNRACEELIGRPFEQLSGRICHYGSSSGSELESVAASLGPPPESLLGQPATIQTHVVRPSGERVTRHIHFVPCHDVQGALVCIIGYMFVGSVETPCEPPHLALHDDLQRLRERLYLRYRIDKILATSAGMRRVLDQVRVASTIAANVVIWGERGTGKELIARTIHAESSRREAPFIPIDCSIMPTESVERDLFGAPSENATRGTEAGGLLHELAGGSLFLKHVTQFPRDLQSRLATFLRDRASLPEERSVRLIAADTTDPSTWLRTADFRSDLFYSISTMVIQVPPLRDRPEDMPLLAQMQVETLNQRGEKQLSGLSPAAVELLRTYDWPGNIRELFMAIESAHARAASTMIEPDDLPLHVRQEAGSSYAPSTVTHGVDFDNMLLEAERRLIDNAIKRAKGNKSLAAELLSISRPRLYRRMVALGLEPAGSPDPEERLGEA